jgi:CTP:molybdopterin cytidylyltransferase MocA
VVEGAYPLELPSNSLLQGPPPRLARCPDWALGPGASLRCGLAALSPDAEAAVVVLADGPDLDPRAVERVADAWRSGGDSLLAATYDGRTRSHPLLLARRAWDDVPDEGLRVRDPVLVRCGDLVDPGDVDRPDELPERLR